MALPKAAQITLTMAEGFSSQNQNTSNMTVRAKPIAQIQNTHDIIKKWGERDGTKRNCCIPDPHLERNATKVFKSPHKGIGSYHENWNKGPENISFKMKMIDSTPCHKPGLKNLPASACQTIIKTKKKSATNLNQMIYQGCDLFRYLSQNPLKPVKIPKSFFEYKLTDVAAQFIKRMKKF